MSASQRRCGWRSSVDGGAGARRLLVAVAGPRREHQTAAAAAAQREHLVRLFLDGKLTPAAVKGLMADAISGLEYTLEVVDLLSSS
uniref:Uncharacterized protein n=1 Tax=Oryza punctata TaxID=4537 RepID=A0A0E0JDS2_ORYPU